MAKIEASSKTSVKDDEKNLVLRGNASEAGTPPSNGGASGLYSGGYGRANPFFNVLVAPGSSYYNNSVVRYSPSGTYARRGFTEWIRLQNMSATGDVNETKKYFKRAVRMIKSLVLKVIGTVVTDGRAEYEATVDPKFIKSDNLLVHQSVEDGDSVHFIQSEDDANLEDVATK